MTAPSPFAPPEPPPVQRLNRNALIAAALLMGLTLVVVVVLVGSKGTDPAPVVEAEPDVTRRAPGFLASEPGALPAPPPPFPDEELLAAILAHRGAPDPEAADRWGDPYPPPPSPPPPPDPRGEALQRALRAPVRTAGEAPSYALAAGPDDRLRPGSDRLPRTPSLAEIRDALLIEGDEPSDAAVQPAADHHQRFLDQARALAPARLAVRLDHPGPGLRVQAGTVLPARLLTAVHSDLPGDLLAQLARPVYDSASQRRVVLPRGTRLLGRYDHQVALGQDRLLVAWTRILLPDGRSLAVPGLPAVQPDGAAGLEGKVHRHYWRVFGNALLLSILGAGAQLSQPQESAVFGQAASARQTAAAALGRELSTVSVEMLRRNLDTRPTIRLEPGTPFAVFLTADLEIPAP